MPVQQSLGVQSDGLRDFYAVYRDGAVFDQLPRAAVRGRQPGLHQDGHDIAALPAQRRPVEYKPGRVGKQFVQCGRIDRADVAAAKQHGRRAHRIAKSTFAVHQPGEVRGQLPVRFALMRRSLMRAVQRVDVLPLEKRKPLEKLDDIGVVGIQPEW